jgi:RNA polymerase sigma-70 factor (ECF subfamily)
MCDVDIQDIQLARNGDGQAYSRIVACYQDRVTAWMWRFTHDRRQLEELVQDVFVQAYFALGRYVDRGQFDSWLFQIATRVGYRFWKLANRQSDLKMVALEDWDGQATDENATTDRAHIVRQVLQRLGPRDRLVLTLRYLEDRSVAQTAKLTGWSQTMVKVQTYRARRRMARLLAQVGIKEDMES